MCVHERESVCVYVCGHIHVCVCGGGGAYTRVCVRVHVHVYKRGDVIPHYHIHAIKHNNIIIIFSIPVSTPCALVTGDGDDCIVYW